MKYSECERGRRVLMLKSFVLYNDSRIHSGHIACYFFLIQSNFLIQFFPSTLEYFGIIRWSILICSNWIKKNKPVSDVHHCTDRLISLFLISDIKSCLTIRTGIHINQSWSKDRFMKSRFTAQFNSNYVSDELQTLPFCKLILSLSILTVLNRLFVFDAKVRSNTKRTWFFIR